MISKLKVLSQEKNLILGLTQENLIEFQVQSICYDLRLGLGCNLGKDLSKKVGMSQLVKHKDTGLYLQLYILIDHKVNVWCIYIKWYQTTWDRNKKTISTTWGTD